MRNKVEECPNNAIRPIFFALAHRFGHFGKALERHAQRETIDCINKILRICDGGDLFEGTELAYGNGVPSTDDLDQVLGLVLQRLHLQQEEISTAENSATFISDKLNELLYPVERRCATLMESVSQGATSRASISAKLCEAILVESLSPENCFSLLKLALECDSEELKICCLQECLSSFQRALGDDLMGLTSLPCDILKFLLSHDELQVSTEEDVLAAIAIWVEHDLSNRLEYFTPLFASCVRFSQLSYSDLSRIVDSCDLVIMSHSATELAAHELIQKTMGISQDNALGMGTITRPRRMTDGDANGTLKANYTFRLISSLRARKPLRIPMSRKHLAPLNHQTYQKENAERKDCKNLRYHFYSAEMLLSPTRPLSGLRTDHNLPSNMSSCTRSLDWS
eukprot:jgi/Picsp_1/475/NSC_00473-R1_kelch-like protein 10-like